jgi:hypothetical protein
MAIVTCVTSSSCGVVVPLDQRALAITEAVLPEGHPDIALRLNNLAYTLEQLGQAQEALPLRQRAETIRTNRANRRPPTG